MKTHLSSLVLTSKWDNVTVLPESAVFLIRSPWASIVSYYDLKVTKKLSNGSFSKVEELRSKSFKQHVQETAKYWSEMVRFWQAPKVPVLTVRYEDLLRDTRAELVKILQFLGQSIHPTLRLECALAAASCSQNLDICAGHHPILTRSVYTSELEEIVMAVAGDYVKKYHYELRGFAHDS